MSNKNLIIKSLGIKNYRSFDTEGIFLKDLNKINLLIGKNNCGKSNVLKFLKALNKLQGAYGSFPNTIENNHYQSNEFASIFAHFSFQELGFPEYLDNDENYMPDFRRKMVHYLEDCSILEYQIKNNEFTLDLKSKHGKEYRFYENEIALAIINYLKITQGYREPIDGVRSYYKNFFTKWLTNLYEKIIYIPDIRILQEKNNIERSNSVFNGATLTSQLSLMINYEVGEEHKLKKLLLIEQKIGEILNVDKVKIHVPAISKELVLDIDNKRFSLENFGTGVHDLVMLCCMLMLNETSLVCVEEPEVHLHPELQRRFIKFLQETEHQYIITTHSNTFLDYLNEDVSIYHVNNDGNRSTVNKLLTNIETRKIIDELGYKASDLLQTNGIIWVEGPSDRIYLNRWISLINNKLKEGIHYTIMFYGGKLLKNLSFKYDESDDLIEMMKINPNIFVIMDKDKFPVNKTKERISKEVGENNYWITKGQEIENYLSQSVINKWLISKDLKRISDDTILNKKFETLLKVKNPAFKYEAKKSIYATQIVEHFEFGDLNYFDLKEKMSLLITLINKWNLK